MLTPLVCDILLDVGAVLSVLAVVVVWCCMRVSGRCE
jgi:hypothetical protein